MRHCVMVCTPIIFYFASAMTMHAAGIHEKACIPLFLSVYVDDISTVAPVWQDCENETDHDGSDPLLNHLYVGRKTMPEESNRCICTDLQPRFAHSFERKTSVFFNHTAECMYDMHGQAAQLVDHN